MPVKRFFIVFAILGTFAVAAMAQTSASVVKVSAAPVKIKRGSLGTGTVTLTIDNGYHINSNRPTEEFLIATALKLEMPKGLLAKGVVYPRAKMQKFAFSPKALAVYDGQVILKFKAQAASIAAGTHTIKGKLTIQACNDEACLRPQTVDVSIPIEVQ